MRSLILFLTLSFITITTKAGNRDSVTNYFLPDSLKAVMFITDIKIESLNTRKEYLAGIRDGAVSISLEADKNKRELVFSFPETAGVAASGIGTDTKEKGEIEWSYNWLVGETYKLMLAVAADSAENFIIYSGYIFLAKENKWKLIGSCKITGRWGTIKNPATYFTTLKKNRPLVHFSNSWCQRNTGSWKKLDETNSVTPVVNLYPHIDSTQQANDEMEIINNSTHSRETYTGKTNEGIYYTILKEGTGRQVQVTDTVTVHYKGYLFADGTVFDQTKDKPATFGLKRLIKGWQLGVPLCKVGGKIKLVIPSGLGYSIRTRAAKIPPNSILVFEIEVLDAKEGK
jgi:FKBP-type peptidyl-prolyl cis-trans isomerase FkpA